MKLTGTRLIRWSGLAATAAGVIFAAIQPIHPLDALASVTTSAWAAIMPVKLAMCFLFLLGMTGLYARQADRAGWLGLGGYLLFGLSWALNSAYIFVEGFILPRLATTAPEFVEGFLGIFNGHPTGLDLGALPGLYSLVGILYLLGSLLFGIATFRAGILPRWAAGFLAAAGPVAPVAVALLPHALERYAAVPLGIALACLGVALWSERRAHASAPQAETGAPRLSQIGAD